MAECKSRLYGGNPAGRSIALAFFCSTKEKIIGDYIASLVRCTDGYGNGFWHPVKDIFIDLDLRNCYAEKRDGIWHCTLGTSYWFAHCEPGEGYGEYYVLYMEHMFNSRMHS